MPALYYLPGSSPCRAVMLTAKALGIELEFKTVDVLKGEQLEADFLQMNPRHTIPTLDDDGFFLNESRAIMGYLVQQYGEDDTLYPKDPKPRALVDEKLYFDIGTLYQRFCDYYYPVIFYGSTHDDSKKEKCEEALGFLNTYLESTDYVAGDTMTIADLAIVATVSTYDVFGFDLSFYPNIEAWYERMKENAPDYDETNHQNAVAFKELADSLIAGNE